MFPPAKFYFRSGTVPYFFGFSKKSRLFSFRRKKIDSNSLVFWKKKADNTRSDCDGYKKYYIKLLRGEI